MKWLRKTPTTLMWNGASLHFTLTTGACGAVKHCGETPHHLTAPWQQSHLCAEAHRGIVVKAPVVRMKIIILGVWNNVYRFFTINIFGVSNYSCSRCNTTGKEVCSIKVLIFIMIMSIFWVWVWNMIIII